MRGLCGLVAILASSVSQFAPESLVKDDKALSGELEAHIVWVDLGNCWWDTPLLSWKAPGMALSVSTAFNSGRSSRKRGTFKNSKCVLFMIRWFTKEHS